MCVTFFILWLVAAGPLWPVAGDSGATSSQSTYQVATDYALGRGVSGRRCASSCAAGGGRCFTYTGEWPLPLEPCWYLQYYAAQFWEKKPLCSGPCVLVKLGYICVINATASDFCNFNSHHELVYEARTLVGGEQCTDACTADARGAHVCRNPSGEHAACDPRALHYFRAHTRRGEPCTDSCEPRGLEKWLGCHTADGTHDPCAPPARWYMRAATTLPPAAV